MDIEYDMAKLPDGNVFALINGKWRSVEITDIVCLQDMIWLDEHWSKATEFRFTRNGVSYYWKHGAVKWYNKTEEGGGRDKKG